MQGGRRLPWATFDRRADGVARALLDAGLGHQAKVALYLYNCPEYLEAFLAACKAALVPVNTNYRYGPDELVYLWDDADAETVVFDASFAEQCDAVRQRVPAVRLWLCVGDPVPAWAARYEDAVTATDRVSPPWGRSGDDLVLLYTGGTTGMPKGVMWRQDDFVGHMHELGRDGAIRHLPACPLMHGTGIWPSLSALAVGGSVVLLEGRQFDAVELWDTVERERVQRLAIVGDAFARPMVEALDAAPERWDLTNLRSIVSSGSMWSRAIKERMSVHLPNVALVDTLASSEAIGLSASVSGAGRTADTARFKLGRGARILTDAGVDAAPGEVGLLAVGGRNPIGYYKDPERSARTFPMIDGVRHSVPGDLGRLEADGTVTLLGRGSSCINTAGEKVFAEEVEEVIKTLAGVRDAAVLGVPDERFGEVVAAVVAAPAGAVSGDEVVAHVKARLAGYKAPRRVVVVDDLRRHVNGKLDHEHLRSLVDP